MNTFRQSCPHCGRTLELPADATGRLGKCPACEATFTIGKAIATDGNSPFDSTTSRDPGPIVKPIDDSPAEDDSANLAATDEPFTPPEELPAAHRLLVTECSIEDILSTTLSIFATRWRLCIKPFVILSIVTFFVVVLPMVILDALNKSGATSLAKVGYLFLLPFVFAFAVAASLGLARVALAVAKNESTPLMLLLAPRKLILRAMGVSLLLTLVIGVVFILMFTFAAIVDAAGAKSLARLLGLVAAAAALTFLFGSAWQLWGWLFVCADDKGTAIGCLRAAQAITSQNKMVSFFVVLIAVVLALTGTLMFLVGHVVTAPLTILLFAVSYLMTTGQHVSDPRDVATFS